MALKNPPNNFAVPDAMATTLQKTSFAALLAASLMVPAFAAEQSVTTDIGTLDKQTSEKVFPAKPPLFSERERAALAWAEAVTRVSETGVPDAAFQAARAAFEEKELVDLTIAISLMNAYNRMAISFRNTPRAALEN